MGKNTLIIYRKGTLLSYIVLFITCLTSLLSAALLMVGIGRIIKIVFKFDYIGSKNKFLYHILTASQNLVANISDNLPIRINKFNMTELLIFFVSAIIFVVSYFVVLNMLKKLKYLTRKPTLNELKEELKKWLRELFFLSIDVVSSTAIKEGESSDIVAHDFAEYKIFLQEILSKNHCIKSAWTPDGVMCCFTNFSSAFIAASMTIEGLNDFNNKHKHIRADFRVRCGINKGYLYFDETMTMEEMGDKAIDIAAHIQELAKPGTINANKKAIPQEAMKYFRPANHFHEGCEIYRWEKKNMGSHQIPS